VKKKNIGSSFDGWLREDGTYEEVTATAIKRVLARQVDCQERAPVVEARKAVGKLNRGIGIVSKASQPLALENRHRAPSIWHIDGRCREL